MKSFDYSTYLSPFTWRYGSEDMRKIWSERNKRRLWRKMWLCLARAQYTQGLVSKEELEDLIKYQSAIDIDRAHEIEKETHHDLMAEIKVYAEQAKIGGGKLHLGATSMDIEDNADTLRIRDSLLIIENELKQLLSAFAEKIKVYADTPCMAYTHLQPAEPTTLGYRFALYAQDVLFDLQQLTFVGSMLKGKGMKGAVGTSASYEKLFGSEGAEIVEEETLKPLELPVVMISGQTTPRKIESYVGQFLSSISATLYKFAFDFRIMQSPGFSEWSEPFGEKQVGSSAMPFKRNPILSEQICSLARFVLHISTVLSDNASHMLLERTLDDSANRRIVLPELFLATDTILTNATNIVSNMVINEKQIEKNLSLHGPFAGTESVMMVAVKNGADRQHMHEILRDNSMKAYQEMQNSGINPLANMLENDLRITKYIKKSDIKKLLDPLSHIGLAGKKCRDFLKVVNGKY